MRPVGAIVLGAYIDRIGRRQGLIVTLAIMAIGTVVIAFCPSLRDHRHRRADHRAGRPPAAGLFRRRRARRRLGLSLRRSPRRAIAASTPRSSRPASRWRSSSRRSSATSSARACRPTPSRPRGWRIPFFVGCMIIPVIFLLRRSLEETPAFLAMKKHPTASRGVRIGDRELAHRHSRHDDRGADHDDLLFRHGVCARLRQGAQALDVRIPCSSPCWWP